LNPEAFTQQQLENNKSLHNFNSTAKYLDSMGRKPPSRHYLLDEKNKKIYTSLYPEPGQQ